jgi:O-antigen ligase
MILVYFLVSLFPLAKHPLWHDRFGEMTVIKYVGLACLAYALFYLTVRPHSARYFATVHSRLFVAFYLLTVISYLSHGPTFSLVNNPFLSYLSFLLFFFIALTVVDSLHRVRLTILVAIGSVAWASIYVIREWQKYGGTIRPGWIVGDANYFTASALLCLPLAYCFIVLRRPPLERFFCLASIGLTLVAVTLGASRGGFLGLVAAAFFVLCRGPQPLRRFVILSAATLTLTLILPVSPIHRLLAPSVTDEHSADSRITVWTAGTRMVVAHPFAGIGLGNFKDALTSYLERGGPLPDGRASHIAHNTYLEIAAELGLPGLFLFVAMLAAALASLETVQRNATQTGQTLVRGTALGLQGGLLAFAVSALFVSLQYQKLFWLMLFLSMCLPRLAPGSGRSTRAPRRDLAALLCSPTPAPRGG